VEPVDPVGPVATPISPSYLQNVIVGAAAKTVESVGKNVKYPASISNTHG
jgi:hypothetical protein